MPVNTVNTAYSDNLPTWELIRDCIKGQKAIKDKTTIYLPAPREGNANSQAYQTYIKRAVFEGVTKRTLIGMRGVVFRKPSKVELPKQLEYLNENADGKGSHLDTVAQKVFSDAISIGRCGVLVEYPKTEGNPTLAQMQENYLRATIQYYKAENIVNWCTRRVGANSYLDMVVLRECVYVCDDKDPFNFQEQEQYRVLLLDAQGFYYQQVYNLKDSKSTDFILREEIYPTDSAGNMLRYLPFTFVGSVDNTEEINDAPLEDIANLNVAHYRNSADFEEMVFITGQPTAVFTGLNQNWIEDVFQGEIKFGSRSAVMLPPNANAQLLQISPSQIGREAMAEKKLAMVELGARLITDKAGVEAAETIRLRQSGEASIMATAAENVSNAMLQCLKWAAKYMGESEDKLIYEINKDYFDIKMTPEEARMNVELWQSNVIPLSVVRDNLRQGEIINDALTDEKLDEEINKFDEKTDKAAKEMRAKVEAELAAEEAKLAQEQANQEQQDETIQQEAV